MPVRLKDPMLRCLASGSLAVYGNPEITFEGTSEDIMEWIQREKERLVEKSAEERIVITKLPERSVTEIDVRAQPAGFRRSTIVETYADVIGDVGSETLERKFKEKGKEFHPESTSVSPDLVLVHIHPEEMITEDKDVTVKYKKGMVGPYEMILKVKSKK